MPRTKSARSGVPLKRIHQVTKKGSTLMQKGGLATSPGITPPLKWHGGKQYLANSIVEMMPSHIHYIEPYFGGGAVLLAKNPEGVSEVVNDINGELMNFWEVLRNEETFAEFHRQVTLTPCSEATYAKAESTRGVGSAVQRAWSFFVMCRQSRAATFDGFTTLAKTRTRRGMNELPSAWLTAIDGLPVVHARLSRVVILCRDALECIRTQDGPQTLFYLDPPYLHETRATDNVYEHEMSAAQHLELLDTLSSVRGKFLLSGYRSQMYDDAAGRHGWNSREFDMPNNAAGGKTKRRMIECVWMNF